MNTSIYQIGTEEPRGVVGSRAARGQTLEDALGDAKERSRSRWVKSAWVRESYAGGKLGPVIATFIKGQHV